MPHPHSEQQGIRTPLARARGLGSAGEGVHHWWMQRLTAVILLPLVPWFAFGCSCMRDGNYLHFVTWLGQPLQAILAILAVVALFYHAMLGCQVVIEDYVHNRGMKFFLLTVMKAGIALMTVASLYAILHISFVVVPGLPQ